MPIEGGAQEQVADQPQIVELVGESDVATSNDLREHLEAIAGGTDPRVVVDLCSAEFIDSSTLGVLAVASKRFGAERFAIVCPPGEVRMMFELTALERVVPLYETRAEALAAFPSSPPPGGPGKFEP
jgi:anti-sigma B factor antagonist